MSEETRAQADAGAPVDGGGASRPKYARALDLQIVRGTTGAKPNLRDRLGGSVDALTANTRLTQKPPERLKRKRPIDRIRGFLSFPTPPQSPADKSADAMKVPDNLRDKTSGGKKAAPGEHTIKFPGATF